MDVELPCGEQQSSEEVEVETDRDVVEEEPGALRQLGPGPELATNQSASSPAL